MTVRQRIFTQGRDVNGRFIEARIATLALAFALRAKVEDRLAPR